MAKLTEQQKIWNNTISVDFDGVLHNGNKGWRDGECYGEPLDGSVEAMQKLTNNGFYVVVLTARDDLYPVIEWLVKHEIPYYSVTNVKTPSRAYIDDRAIRFTNWDDVTKYFL